MGSPAPRHEDTQDEAPPCVELTEVAAGYGERCAVEGVSIAVRPGELLAVLGPNGAGKSTLLRVMAGLLPPRRGRATLLGEDLASLSRRAIAQRIAVVPQQADVALGFTVREVVAMGRAPHQGVWMRPSARDREAVAEAMAACELAGLSGRPVATLSGGERKRVAIARALAQASHESGVLLLDEPAAHLDVRHAVDLFELLRAETAKRRLACVAVLHDLNVAARYADRVALLEAGRLVASGRIEEVMTYRRLKDAFGAELYVGVCELDDARYFLPVRPRPPG